MPDRYSQWLLELSAILEKQEHGEFIHPVHAEMLAAGTEFIDMLKTRSRDEVAGIIIEGPGHEADSLFAIYGELYSLKPEEIYMPAGYERFINAAVRMLVHWKFHLMTVYHAEGDTFSRTCIDIAGRVFEEEITAEEFAAHRNASSAAHGHASSMFFGMRMSDIWQPGHGDDLAFRLDRRYIISFTDIHESSRKPGPHEITGIAFAAWILDEKIRGRRDPLTGLPNRRAWDDHVMESESAGGYYIMIAPDGFKDINDRYGHMKGDAVVKKTGEILKSAFAGTGRIYRWSGAEFLVFTENPLAVEIAESFRSMVESADFSQDGSRIRVTVSAGISYCDSAGGNVYENIESAVKRADSGVAAAKRNGRNRVEFIST